ncbi:MAG: peptidylprolyl isomerase [Candidatus Moranbacteria bacterium]|nr:peptidylprolyl isomerase [Candidatus Moranbacteria bacterium]
MKPLYLSMMVASALLLSGCSTPELRQEQEIKDNLDFTELEKKAATTKEQSASKTAPTTKQPVTQSVTSKKMYQYSPVMAIDQSKEYSATLKTSAGTMVIKLGSKETPTTVNNFVFLAKEKFYDGTIFHRTIPGFMIQGGDPEGTGMGGPGYKFSDEPFTGKYERGTIAMANSGPNTNGSQFFIMHQDYPLPPNYVIFGKVTEGLEVIDIIAKAPTKPGGEGSTPVTPMMIETVTITEQ